MNLSGYPSVSVFILFISDFIFSPRPVSLILSSIVTNNFVFFASFFIVLMSNGLIYP